MKHKHADLIHAWADGAKVEFFDKFNNVWWDSEFPDWYEDQLYRIKPEPKPDIVAYTTINFDIKHTGFLVGFLSFEKIGNLRLTFDGETGKLKSAEVI
jgi:hypothetical protein